MASRPPVSVIVPAFNAADTLADAVRSALQGTYTNIELIIVDDGSADSTAEIADDLARSDSRVRVHHRENGGVSAAFNSGLARASGDYVARLDADDLWHPSKLDRQIRMALGDPQAAFIYTWVRYIDAGGRVQRDLPAQRFPPRALCRGIYESIIGANSSALMRMDVVQRVGGYEEPLRSCEDLLLQLRISANYRVAYVPEYLVGYRVRPGALSTRPADVLANWRKALERIASLFPQVPAYVRDWAHARRCMEFAEGFAWAGQWSKTASLLAEALRFDPARTSTFLSYRLARHLRHRLWRPAQCLEPGPRFSDCSPEEQTHLSAFDRGMEGERLRKLELGRAELLAKLDETLRQ